MRLPGVFSFLLAAPYSVCTKYRRCWRVRHLAIYLALLLPFSGCSPKSRATLVIHNGAEPETIDPQVLAALSDGRVASALFEGLVRQDPVTAKPIPGLASAWSVSPDGLAWTFEIRTNACWSDGVQITAADFVWSWRRAVSPSTGARNAGQFAYLRNGAAIYTGKLTNAESLGVRAIDPHRLEVLLEHPTPYLTELLAGWVFFPVPRHTVERLGTRWTMAEPLPCSGPYRLTDWRLNDRLSLHRNEKYWDAVHVRSETIDLIHGENATTALNLFLTGGVDMVLDNSLFPSDLNDLLAARPDFCKFDYLATYFLRFNCTRKPFDDSRVRRALAMAIRRQRIVERITRMGERTATALVPPGTGGYTPPEGLREDTAEAQRLLAEAGYPGGQGFPIIEYTYSTNSKVHEQIGVEIQQMLLENLGIRITLRPLETKTYFSEMSLRHFDIIRGAWIGDFDDPSNFLDIFESDSGNNRTGWRNSGYDRLLAAARQTPAPDTRFTLLRQAEELLVGQEAPIACLFQFRGLYAADPERIGGIHPNSVDRHPLWAIYKKEHP